MYFLGRSSYLNYCMLKYFSFELIFERYLIRKKIGEYNYFQTRTFIKYSLSLSHLRVAVYETLYVTWYINRLSELENKCDYTFHTLWTTVLYRDHSKQLKNHATLKYLDLAICWWSKKTKETTRYFAGKKWKMCVRF